MCKGHDAVKCHLRQHVTVMDLQRAGSIYLLLIRSAAVKKNCILLCRWYYFFFFSGGTRTYLVTSYDKNLRNLTIFSCFLFMKLHLLFLWFTYFLWFKITLFMSMNSAQVDLECVQDGACMLLTQGLLHEYLLCLQSGCCSLLCPVQALVCEQMLHSFWSVHRYLWYNLCPHSSADPVCFKQGKIPVKGTLKRIL